MRNGVVYYANDVIGKFYLAIKYLPSDPLPFCKAVMLCGVFATVTPVGNVRVFTHRQVSRLLSGKPVVLTISFIGDKLSVQIWKEDLFNKEFSLSDSLSGILIENAENNKRTDVSSFYYVVKETNDNLFFKYYDNLLSHNYTLRDGKFYLHSHSVGVIEMPKAISPGTLVSIRVDDRDITITPLKNDLNSNLSTVSSLVLITMFLKVVGKSGTYCDMMTINLASTMFSKNDVIRMGINKLLENMGYAYTETSKSVAILYPVGCEDDAAVVNKNNILSFQMEKKEMVLSIVDWDEKESDN